jgi:hypothetical protein
MRSGRLLNVGVLWPPLWALPAAGEPPKLWVDSSSVAVSAFSDFSDRLV